MMMRITSKQGALLIISQIYFHYILVKGQFIMCTKPPESESIKPSLSEMIIKDQICHHQDDMGNGMMPGIRDVAWGTPCYRLIAGPCSAERHIVGFRGRWLKDKLASSQVPRLTQIGEPDLVFKNSIISIIIKIKHQDCHLSSSCIYNLKQDHLDYEYNFGYLFK